MRSTSLLFLTLAIPLCACGSDDDSGTGPSNPNDAGVTHDVANDDGAADTAIDTTVDTALDTIADDAVAQDGSTDATADATQDAEGDASAVTATEEEPNDGTTLQEYNDLPMDVRMEGTVGTVGDSDVFRVEAPAGKVIRVALDVPTASELQGHVAVFDDGRGTKPAGDDYVKTAVGAAPVVELLSMDSGGYFVAVRDVRNLDEATVGGSGFTYVLRATEHETSEYEGDPLVFPSQFDDTLSQPSGLKLYAFDGTAGADILIDMQAQGTMDGRLMIFSQAVDSWIARNDDRTIQDVDPLIDAFLSENGPMLLVVENIDEEATQLSYQLDVALP